MLYPLCEAVVLGCLPLPGPDMDVPFLLWLVGLLRALPFPLGGRGRALVASGAVAALAPVWRTRGRLWFLRLMRPKNVLHYDSNVWAAEVGSFREGRRMQRW
jgi:hypothetical protein